MLPMMGKAGFQLFVCITKQDPGGSGEGALGGRTMSPERLIPGRARVSLRMNLTALQYPSISLSIPPDTS